jgi:hypothetical protein
VVPPPPPSVVTNTRAFRVLVRNELFRRVQLAAREHYDELGALDGVNGFNENTWADAMDGYFAEHDELLTGADARSSALLILDEGPGGAGTDGVWTARQIFDDPAGDHDWGISAVIDLAASDEAGEAVVRVTAVNRL